MAIIWHVTQINEHVSSVVAHRYHNNNGIWGLRTSAVSAGFKCVSSLPWRKWTNRHVLFFFFFFRLRWRRMLMEEGEVRRKTHEVWHARSKCSGTEVVRVKGRSGWVIIIWWGQGTFMLKTGLQLQSALPLSVFIFSKILFNQNYLTLIWGVLVWKLGAGGGGNKLRSGKPSCNIPKHIIPVLFVFHQEMYNTGYCLR